MANTTNNPQQFLDRDGLSTLWGRITTEFAPRWKSYRPLLTNESFATNQTPPDIADAHQTNADGLCIDFASAGVLTLEDGTVYGKGIRVKLPRVVAPTDGVANSGKDGIMSWEDKQKLDSIESTAENAVTIKGVKVGINSDDELRKLKLDDKFVNWDLRFDSTVNELQVVDVNNENAVLTKVNVKDFVSDAIKEGFLVGASLVTSKPLGNNQVKEGTYIKLTFKIKDGSDTENNVSDVYLDVNDLIDVYTAGTGISINNDLTNDTVDGTPRTTEISLKTAQTGEIGGVKIKRDNTSLDNTSTLKTTNQNGRYFGVEINKDDVAFVNVPIGELGVGDDVLSGTPITVDPSTGGEFTIVTGINSEPAVETNGDITGNTITLNTCKVEIAGETSITKVTPDLTESVEITAHNKGTFTAITEITPGGTNGHELTLTKTTYTLPVSPSIDNTTDSTKDTTKQLVANYTDSAGNPTSTSTILKDITTEKVIAENGVESYVITKTYETIDVHVTPIDISFINGLTLMTS